MKYIKPHSIFESSDSDHIEYRIRVVEDVFQDMFDEYNIEKTSDYNEVGYYYSIHNQKLPVIPGEHFSTAVYSKKWKDSLKTQERIQTITTVRMWCHKADPEKLKSINFNPYINRLRKIGFKVRKKMKILNFPSYNTLNIHIEVV